MPQDPKTYTIVSTDGHKFTVSDKMVAMSDIWVELVKDSPDASVLIPEVDGKTLKYIVDYCRHYEHDLVYIPPAGGDPNIVQPDAEHWDMKFLQIRHDDLLNVVNAANRMNLLRLKDACCFRLGLMIQGRSSEEIRTIFRIENDFTPEEEAQIAKDGYWADCPLPPNPKW